MFSPLQITLSCDCHVTLISNVVSMASDDCHEFLLLLQNKIDASASDSVNERGCRQWQGCLDNSGNYGKMWVSWPAPVKEQYGLKNGPQRVHRLVYLIL